MNRKDAQSSLESTAQNVCLEKEIEPTTESFPF